MIFNIILNLQSNWFIAPTRDVCSWLMTLSETLRNCCTGNHICIFLVTLCPYLQQNKCFLWPVKYFLCATWTQSHFRLFPWRAAKEIQLKFSYCSSQIKLGEVNKLEVDQINRSDTLDQCQ